MAEEATKVEEPNLLLMDEQEPEEIDKPPDVTTTMTNDSTTTLLNENAKTNEPDQATNSAIDANETTEKEKEETDKINEVSTEISKDRTLPTDNEREEESNKTTTTIISSANELPTTSDPVETTPESSKNPETNSSESTAKVDNKESIEDRYNKLRGFAVKLKKKVADLSESLKKAELEREKAVNEKKELDNQLKALADNTKDLQIQDLQAEVMRLSDLVSASNEELESLKTEFNGYKLRAQSVLRTRANQVGVGRSIAEVEEELQQTRHQLNAQREKCDAYRQQLETSKKENVLIKEERDLAIENKKESNQKIFLLKQELSSVIGKLEAKTNENLTLQTKHQEELAQMREAQEAKLLELEEHYRKKIDDLKSELMSNPGYEDVSKSMHERNLEQISTFDPHMLLTDSVLPKREEGEGSESTPPSILTSSHMEKYRGHSSIPLDELLNMSDNMLTDGKVLSTMVERKELEVCERRVKHLTALLSDAEKDIAKLTQLNEMLKEDIRRQQRSVEREQHANNFEYLKNVVFKFVTLKNGDERNHLIPVLTTILKLSPEETQKLNAVAGVGGRSWIPAIPISGWNNN